MVCNLHSANEGRSKLDEYCRARNCTTDERSAREFNLTIESRGWCPVSFIFNRRNITWKKKTGAVSKQITANCRTSHIRNRAEKENPENGQ